MEEPRRLGGRYELGGVLGRGGMAEVYLAHDTRLGRSVAVKTLRADMARDPSFQARFRREAQSAASLNHPAIVAVYDTGEDYIDGISIPYIVMEYVEGSTLRELLHSGRRLLPERALEMTIGILQALEYSHRAGIVHRDIKPANVMLTRQGNVKVMDFGIARAMGDAGMTMTQTSAVIGTAQYLSPEQAKGEQVDARSDLYSTGCLLYELLTVRPPFVGDSPVAVAYQHVREEAQPPSVFDPEVRPEVDAIVLKALAKERDYRYQTADEMRDDIERFLDGLPVAAAQQAAYGMGAAGYGYDQNGYPQHDPYGQTNVLPQQPGGGPTTLLPQASAQPGYAQQGGYQDDGYGQTYAGAPVGGGDGYDDGYGREGGRRRDDQPKKSNTSWIVLAVAAVLVLVGTFFVAQAMFNGGGDKKDAAKIAAPNLVGKSLADAKTAAAQTGPKLVVTEGEKIACPDANVKKDQVCTQNPQAGTQVAENGTITVQVSSGPTKATMPTVTGKTKDQAMQALSAAGFTNVSAPEYKDDDTAPQDTVLAQDPAANTPADPTAPVKLTVSQGKSKANVPSVVGMQKEAAQAQLESAGFQVDASKTAVTNDPTKINTVASQSPGANTKAPANSKITLTVYKAPDKATVPPLQNVKLSDAIAQLQKAGLGYAVNGPSDPNAVVIMTNPPAGTQLDPNSQVALTTKPADQPKGGDPFPFPTPPKGNN